MSASEASILARLEQMKKWQEQHYSRLMSRHHQNLEQASLLPSNKEERNETKAKRPFLRKGAGLARYRLTAGQQRRPYRGGTLPHFRSPRKQVKFIDSGVTDSGATVLTPLKKPDVAIQTANGCTWTDVLSHQVDSDVASVATSESCDEEVPSVVTVDADCDVYEREPSPIPVLSEDFQESGGEDETLVNANTSQADLIVFEELERRAAHSSFCSTNSSVVRLLATSSPRKPYNTDRQLDTVEAEQLQRELEFAALQAETEKLRRIYNSDLFISTATDQETCSTCCAKPTAVRDVATMTDIPELRLSHEAMEEIECERRLCRKEQIRVERLRAQLEEEQRQFRKEKKELLRQVESERESTREKAEEERRKLAKERMVFERYVKDLQSKPSKKDREELSALKTELCNLRELLKVKDTKNGTTQARLRNAIKSLEKENDRLKVDNENLQRQNARLLALQTQNQRKKSPSDTRMLHEINKNLTRLARDMKASGGGADEEVVVRAVEVDESEVKENCARRKRESAEREKERVARDRATSLVRDKENDVNVANNSDDIERSYEKVFGNLSSESQQKDRVEEILDDGTTVIKYPNGNVKKRSPDGNRTVLNFYNGDVKETDLLSGMTRYFYFETKLWHTVNLDGTEVFEYPSGNIEKRYPDGTSTTTDTTGVVNHKYPDGREKTVYADGTVVMLDPTGEKVLTLPNGQKEVHNEMHKRREYPDGTVKILYPDGLQETRYSNGRMRIRDKNGKLIMDSFDNDN